MNRCEEKKREREWVRRKGKKRKNWKRKRNGKEKQWEERRKRRENWKRKGNVEKKKKWDGREEKYDFKKFVCVCVCVYVCVCARARVLMTYILNDTLTTGHTNIIFQTHQTNCLKAHHHNNFNKTTTVFHNHRAKQTLSVFFGNVTWHIKETDTTIVCVLNTFNDKLTQVTRL